MNTNPLTYSTDLKALLEAFGLPEDTKAELGATPGCFTAELPAAVYHSTKNTISHTGMLELLRSPAHYREYLESSRDRSTPNIGTATHSAVLEPATFTTEYPVFLGSRRGSGWNDFQAEHTGKLILTKPELTAVLGMKKAIFDFTDFDLKGAISIGESEKSIFWIDEETGVQCRVRIDSLNPCVIFDLKTCGDAREHGFLIQAVKLGYDLEAGMYVEGARRLLGKTLPFAFVAVEEKAPHGVWVYQAPASLMSSGTSKFRQGVRAYKTLCDTNDWHCYKNAISNLEWPKYAMHMDDTIDYATN